MRVDKDIWAGLFFMGLAGLGLWIGADYQFGTPARMGAGFLPKLLCWSLLALGALVTFFGLIRRGDVMETWDWGPLLAILTAVLVFGAALEPVGLEVAIVGAVLLAGVAVPVPSRFEQGCLGTACVLLAVYLLPGGAAFLSARSGIPRMDLVLAAIAQIAVIVAVVSHARRVPFAAIGEQLLVGAVLAVVCIIVFVDALGLTMKSLFVMDAWTIVKRVTVQPLWQMLRALMGY